MSQVMPQRMNRLTRYGVNGFARQLSMPVFTAALLFIGAGTLNWSWGWAFACVYFFSWLGLNLALLRWNPELGATVHLCRCADRAAAGGRVGLSQRLVNPATNILARGG